MFDNNPCVEYNLDSIQYHFGEKEKRVKILITFPFTGEQKTRLEAQMPGAKYVYTEFNEVTDAEIAEADIILGKVPVKKLGLATKLKWLQLSISGADAYAAKGVLAPEVLLTNATGAYGLSVSEHMVGATFFLVRKLGFYYRNQMKGEWKDEGKVISIENSRTLVIGLGNIGGEYARRMALLGSRVTGIRRTKAACPAYLENCGTYEDIDKYLPEADIVAMVLPNTPLTYRLMNKERLAMMKPGSYLINVGRGNAIDQEALVEALKSGHLAGASIDVTEPEPLPSDHPLWKCENLLLTPHVSGGNHLQKTQDNIVDLFIDNLGRYVRGEELQNPVDRETGYRKSVR